MMWSTLIRTRLGMAVMRSRQHYRTVHTARRRKTTPKASQTKRRHGTCGGIVSEWRSSDRIEAVPRVRIPVPYAGHPAEDWAEW